MANKGDVKGRAAGTTAITADGDPIIPFISSQDANGNCEMTSRVNIEVPMERMGK